MKFILVVACVLACAAALPVNKNDNAVKRVELVIEGAKTPADIEESIRKARQVFQDVNVDIISGGQQGFGGGYGGYGGYGGAVPYGYGAYGGGVPAGYQETEIDIVQDNYGK